MAIPWLTSTNLKPEEPGECRLYAHGERRALSRHFCAGLLLNLLEQRDVGASKQRVAFSMGGIFLLTLVLAEYKPGPRNLRPGVEFYRS